MFARTMAKRGPPPPRERRVDDLVTDKDTEVPCHEAWFVAAAPGAGRGDHRGSRARWLRRLPGTLWLLRRRLLRLCPAACGRVLLGRRRRLARRLARLALIPALPPSGAARTLPPLRGRTAYDR